MADTENPEQDPPDTWEARLAYAEQLHAHWCDLADCEGRDDHERRYRVSFMAVVTPGRAGSAYGVPPELAEYMPPDFAAPVASTPVDASTSHLAPVLALVGSLVLQLAQSVVAGPDALAGLSEGWAHGVLAVAQIALVLGAAYGIRPPQRAPAAP